MEGLVEHLVHGRVVLRNEECLREEDQISRGFPLSSLQSGKVVIYEVCVEGTWRNR